MTSPYRCGIPEYDLKIDRPIDNAKRNDHGLYARCICGKLWSLHGVTGFKKCKRYIPKLK
jgi:hypothetical protein